MPERGYVEFQTHSGVRGKPLVQPKHRSRDEVDIDPTSYPSIVSLVETPPLINATFPSPHTFCFQRDTNTQLGQGGTDVAAIPTPPFY
jgi:hypothetical protein